MVQECVRLQWFKKGEHLQWVQENISASGVEQMLSNRDVVRRLRFPTLHAQGLAPLVTTENNIYQTLIKRYPTHIANISVLHYSGTKQNNRTDSI